MTTDICLLPQTLTNKKIKLRKWQLSFSIKKIWLVQCHFALIENWFQCYFALIENWSISVLFCLNRKLIYLSVILPWQTPDQSVCYFASTDVWPILWLLLFNLSSSLRSWTQCENGPQKRAKTGSRYLCSINGSFLHTARSSLPLKVNIICSKSTDLHHPRQIFELYWWRN